MFPLVDAIKLRSKYLDPGIIFHRSVDMSITKPNYFVISNLWRLSVVITLLVLK